MLRLRPVAILPVSMLFTKKDDEVTGLEKAGYFAVENTPVQVHEWESLR